MYFSEKADQKLVEIFTIEKMSAITFKNYLFELVGLVLNWDETIILFFTVKLGAAPKKSVLAVAKFERKN